MIERCWHILIPTHHTSSKETWWFFIPNPDQALKYSQNLGRVGLKWVRMGMATCLVPF